VLLALGLSKDRALASLRFGIGRATTADDIEYAAEKVSGVVKRLRQLSPV
jgi:cysteine desulfurase